MHKTGICREVKMKKVIYCLIFVSFFFQALIFAEPINKKWVNKDAEGFEEVIDFIGKEEYTHSNILNLMRRNFEDRKLGFNLIYSRSAIPGGYLSIYIYYVSYLNLPCELKIIFDSRDFFEIEKELPAKLVKIIKEKFLLNEEHFDFSMKFDKNYQTYYEYKQTQIGNTVKLDLKPQYQEYYDFLTSPINQFPYGYIIGEAPTVPYGRIAMDKLMELKNTDIFINIIKSDNPAGRMYGMEGLLRLDNSTKNMDVVNEVFEKLIEEQITYNSQAGCCGFYELYEKINSENIKNYIQDFPLDLYL